MNKITARKMAKILIVANAPEESSSAIAIFRDFFDVTITEQEANMRLDIAEGIVEKLRRESTGWQEMLSQQGSIKP